MEYSEEITSANKKLHEYEKIMENLIIELALEANDIQIERFIKSISEEDRLSYLESVRREVLIFVNLKGYEVLVSEIGNHASFTVKCGAGDCLSIIPPERIDNPKFYVEIMAILPSFRSFDPNDIKRFGKKKSEVALRLFFDLSVVNTTLNEVPERTAGGAEIFHVYDLRELVKVIRIWYEKFGSSISGIPIEIPVK